MSAPSSPAPNPGASSGGTRSVRGQSTSHDGISHHDAHHDTGHHDALERRYGGLEALPQSLYERVVTHPQGSLEARVAGIIRWREALTEGRLPAPDGLEWPEAALRDALLERLAAFDFARHCRHQPLRVDAFLETLLDTAARLPTLNGIRLAELSTALERLEAARKDAPTRVPRGSAEAEVAVAAADALARAWQDRVRMWDALGEVFQALGAFLGAGWDRSFGGLEQLCWLDPLLLSRLLQEVDALRALVRELGRGPARDGLARGLEALLPGDLPARRTPQTSRIDVQGVARSDDVARMLPPDAALLRTRGLRSLWHARRAERLLSTYHGHQRTPSPRGPEADVAEAETDGRSRGLGPFLLCIDASGSMAGPPGQLARAIALEVVRIANETSRPVYALVFGGPGELRELELSPTPAGMTGLLTLLCTAFEGGTEIDAPLRRALELIALPRWRDADLLLISDGEFDAPEPLVDALKEARDRTGLRVHGIRVGSASSPALDALCDPVLALGGAATFPFTPPAPPG